MDDFGFGSANNGEPDEVQDFLAREQQQFAELHGGTEEQSVVNSDFGASNVNEVNCWLLKEFYRERTKSSKRSKGKGGHWLIYRIATVIFLLPQVKWGELKRL